MKTLKLTLGMVVAFLLITNVNGFAQTFHSGGVGECSGCHSMHAPRAGGVHLLLGTDPSSVCLNCHMKAGDTGPTSYHISTADADMPNGIPPKQRTPGGDFGWLKKNYTFTVQGTTTTEAGETHGHNIVAIDNGYIASTTPTAPGGTFTSSQLGCQSCHDPHSSSRRLSDGTYVRGVTLGQATAPIIASGSYDNSPIPAAGQAVGVYRLLRGLNDSTQPGATFVGVAIAVAPATYNQTEAINQVRVAYGATATNTWGNWCATCHAAFHSNGNYVHPIDQALGTAVANNYNAYIKSGDLTGTQPTSFTSLVPFMENTGDTVTLASHAKNDNTYLTGPGTSDQVACLSCHRAHASGWEFGFRWDNDSTFIVYNSLYPGIDTTPTVPEFARGRMSAETQGAYYDRTVTVFATFQRVLCNKCHVKD
jgi:hypothetical protein